VLPFRELKFVIPRQGKDSMLSDEALFQMAEMLVGQSVRVSDGDVKVGKIVKACVTPEGILVIAKVDSAKWRYSGTPRS